MILINLIFNLLSSQLRLILQEESFAINSRSNKWICLPSCPGLLLSIDFGQRDGAALHFISDSTLS